MNINKYLDIAPEVKQALDNKQPVVALESTILSHGMPYPENVEFGHKVEKIIRDGGAIPATTAIIDGKLKVGLTPEEIEHMCKPGVAGKVSRRDVATYIATGRSGATTVTTTMMIAEMAGIEVFSTGGLGGVHRGAQETFDISADLQELANTKVAVVCAGAKSLLDLGLTLEYLETMGVPVIGYGTDKFPAFYCRESAFGVDYNASSPAEIAKIIRTNWELGLKSGLAICNPIPEEHALDYDYIEGVINNAMELAKQQGIRGKETTPFLLSHIKELTKGVSFASNLELAYNNARLAAQLACELAKI